ncbi:leucine rich repeat protein [Ichthyophthirius multifiliis]|uniref:Leucine rich repeat protein n=1 Tax=Ichthyophthirius multifiliis TaxID=5932 RepID=G0QUN9_ICHMU|nr:leucine rich repeat protein [Ichthyophthirius multifiliis]EGR31085.1 leucine rich repeat protein [Ichthyophthirius multifiliis]|eukprot:XP_004034571.1 leucine rich repeat protein [Ichthyophthirius multifiliis]
MKKFKQKNSKLKLLNHLGQTQNQNQPKALLTVSIQKMNLKDIKDGGIDFLTFEHGIDKISSQSEEIIKRMCNYESYINWNQFLNILNGISGKTLESKINIFINVADTDKSGTLAKEEISELCNICLKKILPVQNGDDSMIKDLVDYFTKLLFSSLNVDLEDEIPLYKLKDAILNGNPESDLICFFCGIENNH